MLELNPVCVCVCVRDFRLPLRRSSIRRSSGRLYSNGCLLITDLLPVLFLDCLILEDGKARPPRNVDN